MPDNGHVVEVVIRAVDNLSEQFNEMEKRVGAFERRAAAAGVTTEKLARHTASLRQQISPLVGSISQVTNALAQANPQLQTIIGATDNIVLNATRAAAATTTWQAGLLAGVRSVFNPYALGILAIVSGIAALISKYQEAAKQAEEFNAAVKGNNVAFFAEKIIDARGELDTYRQKLEGAQVAQLAFNASIGERPRTPAENAQATVLQNQVDAAKRAMDGAISTVQQYQDAQDKAARAIALKALPALSQQVKLQRESIGANELQKISIEAVNQVNEQLFKGLTEQEIAEYKLQVAKLASAKASDLIKKTNQAVIDSIKSQTAAIDAEIVALTRGAAAQREFQAAQQIQKTEKETGVRIDRGPVNAELKAAEERTKVLERTKISLQQEAETEEGLRFIRQQSVEDVKALADLEQKRVTGPLQASQILLESQRDVLNNQLQVLTDQESPLANILAVARQLDQVEKDILATRIEQQKALIANLEARGEDTQIAEAQLQALENSAKIIGQRVAQITRDTAKEIQAAADSLAKDFVDRFIQLLESKGKGGIGEAVKNLLVTTGRTIVADIGQSILSSVLKPQLGDLKTGSGKTPSNVGELLSAQLLTTFKSLLGIGTKETVSTETTKSPLETASTSLSQVATGPLTSAATVLQEAGNALLAAAQVFNAGKNVTTNLPVAATPQDVVNALKDLQGAPIKEETITGQPAPIVNVEQAAPQTTLNVGGTLGDARQITGQLGSIAGLIDAQSGGILGKIQGGVGAIGSIFTIIEQLKKILPQAPRANAFTDTAGPGTSIQDINDKEFGEMLRSLEQGFQSSTQTVLDNATALSQLSGTVNSTDSVLGGLGKAFDGLGGILDGFGSAVGSVINSLSNSIGSLGGIGGGIGDLFGSIGGGIGDLFGWIGGLFGFAKGGIVAPAHAIHQFADGGIVSPTQRVMRAIVNNQAPTFAEGGVPVSNEMVKKITEFGHGGLVAPSTAVLHAFAGGGIVRGPTLALAGEREPEIFAPIRDTREIGKVFGILHEKNGVLQATRGVAFEDGGMVDNRNVESNLSAGHGPKERRDTKEEIVQNIFVVDQRQRLGPNDVEIIVEDNLHRNGRIALATQHVIKRTR